MRNELYAIIASIIGAVGIAGAFFAGAIASVTALLVVTLVLGAIALLILIIKSIGSRRRDGIDTPFIAAMVGSIVTSIFGLTAIALPTGIVAVALLIGAVAFFLIANIINLVRFLARVLRDDEPCR